MKFSSHALDQLATDLSKFTSPSIPELNLRDALTLQNHILECILGPFSGERNARARHLMTNIVRRIFAATETYKLGRAHALEYVAGDRHWRITPYFLALTQFEACIGYSWQICDLANGLAKGKARVFERGDDSAWERLHGIYTSGTKHSDDIATPARAHAPTTVWLTNDSVASLTGASITFQELSEIVAANNELFYDIQKMAHKKVQRPSPASGGSKRLI